MAKLVILKHDGGIETKAYKGWSWTSFFFGGFPTLFRADFIGFLAWSGINILLMLGTAGVGNLIFGFVWCAVYNKWHMRRLIEKGYRV